MTGLWTKWGWLSPSEAATVTLHPMTATICKHGTDQPIPCPHCQKDATVLSGIIDRVVDIVFPEEDDAYDQKANLRLALRELIRELRR